MQSNIRVNITNSVGNRTSTTVNFTIAEFYCKHVLGHDVEHGNAIHERITDEIATFIKEHNLTSKEAIEDKLLLSIYNHQVTQIVIASKKTTDDE